MVLQVLLAFFLGLLSLQGVASCLQCDPRFLKWVVSLLKETLPDDLPNRPSLITRHIQALADLHGTFLQRNYERILDVRGVMSIKLHIINQLRTIKRTQWKGVFLWQLSMYQLRFSLRKKIHQILEKFADLACSEDCTVIEGPILDCWTCLRITTQCFDGEVCGVEDRRLAEYNEIVLYVFLVCESVITTSIILVIKMYGFQLPEFPNRHEFWDLMSTHLKVTKTEKHCRKKRECLHRYDYFVTFPDVYTYFMLFEDNIDGYMVCFKYRKRMLLKSLGY